MSDVNEPKKETVRITLPPPPGAKPVAKSEDRDTVRINLPARAPTNGTMSEAPRRATPPMPPPSSKAVAPPPMARPPIPTPSTGAVRPPPPPAPRPPMPAPTSANAPRPPAPPTFAKPTPPPAPPVVRPPVAPASAPPTPAPVSQQAAPIETTAAPAPAAEVSAPVMPPRPRVLPPPPRAPAATSPTARAVTAAPANYPGSGTQAGPKKETARISILPEPAARPSPTVKMTKTQPLMAAPDPKVNVAAVKVAPAVVPTTRPTSGALFDKLDAIPMPICWTIFAISSVTLLIQIWNYLSS